MSHRIVLLGTDRYVADECTRRGLDTIAVRNASAARNGLVRLPAAVRELHVNRQDHLEDVLCSLSRAGVSIASLDAVQTSNEFCVVTASAIGELAGVPAVPTATAVRMRDKYLQKLAVREAGVPVTGFRYFPVAPAADDVADMRFPLVVKPVSGAGAEATVRIDRPTDLAAAVAGLATGRSPSRGHLIEEFVDGDEYVLDGVCQGGELVFSSLGRYSSPCLEVVSEQRPFMMHRCTGPEYEQRAASARALAIRALTALGLSDGVFHLEMFLNADDEMVFSECAARRGGALIEEEVRYAYRYSLAAAAVDLAVGAPVRVPGPPRPGVVGTTFLLLPPGLVLDLPRRDELMSLPGVRFIRYDTHIGARLDPTLGSTDQRAAIALVTGADESELEQNMAALHAGFAEGAVVAPLTSPRDMRDFQAGTLGRPDLSDQVYLIDDFDRTGALP